MADFLLIGVTTDKFAHEMKNHDVEPFEVRKKAVENFLKSKGFKDYEIFPIDDPYGPCLTLKDIYAIIVSEETLFRAEEINELRKSRGLSPLKVFVVDMLLAEDGKPISSSRIRKGEIDREGRLLRK